MSFRARGIDGPISGRCCVPACCYPANPCRRIAHVLTAADRDSEVANGDDKAAHRFGGQAAVVQGSTFDQQVWPTSRAAQLPDLSPEVASGHRLMQIGDALTLDQGNVAEQVIACLEAALLNVDPEPHELRRDAGLPFVNVCDQSHRPRLPRQVCPYCAGMEKKASPAISQGEMA